MSPVRLSVMELKPTYDIENANSELWPLGEIDPKKISRSNFVNVDEFAYGAVARYLQLDREQVCVGLEKKVVTVVLMF
ncbi:Protein REVERSION-TO-ETHYLENE SENSITIVITY1 [Camellia lanceoleosa]|uniref:Protein REVERSION-TO-ETHYLENE SENSITIVITY1 n=1 Tax=Camellia lanceoleosa TaxID=1840588 RepID=A0ACC0FI70_9ERIC|nr:Protein REVERSION-TO-ETHYLENE SENSITIVITY1 [Camellia lanceoleosa]